MRMIPHNSCSTGQAGRLRHTGIVSQASRLLHAKALLFCLATPLLAAPASWDGIAHATHLSWTRSGENADSPWTKLFQPFNGEATGSGLELTDNTDGSYRFRARSNESNFDCILQGAAYAFNPGDFPFLRFRIKTPETNSMVFGALPDWEQSSLPTTSNTLNYAHMASFGEIRSRFANIATHIQQEAIGNPRYTKDGFRFDLVTDTTDYDRDFDIDYIAVDSHPCLAIDEFDMEMLDALWTVSNLWNIAIDNGSVTGQISGAASLSLPVAVDGEYWNMLEIRLARDPGATNGFAFAWRTISNVWEHVEVDPIADDGQFHYYQIDLAKCPEWFTEPVAEVRFLPFSPDAANNGLGFRLDYLRLRHMPVMGGSSMEWGSNLKAEQHVHRWNTGNALMRYFGTSLAIWNAPGRYSDIRSGFARLAQERSLRLTCTIQSAKFFEGPEDFDGDGLDEYRIPRDTHGQPSPQLAAELAFAHINQLGEDMESVGYDEMYIGFDGLMRYLMFPTYRVDTNHNDVSGGFYEAAGSNINQTVYDQCAETVITLMQMCHTNPVTQNFHFRIYPNFHMWQWEGLPRDMLRDPVECGNFRPVVDAIHAANQAAFPGGDSPLIIFDADYPENFVTWGNKCRKLVHYQEYIQNLGYLASCNAVRGSDSGLEGRIEGHRAATNFVGMITRYGGRPDIINSGWWHDNWKGSFWDAAVDEEDVEEYNLTSLWPKLMSLISADTGTRVFNESLPEFFAAGSANELYKPSASHGADYSGSLAMDAHDTDLNDELVYSKLSGPDWLSVAPDGTLSGIPLADNIGTNSFTVRVADDHGGIDDITMFIVVAPFELPVEWANQYGISGSTNDADGDLFTNLEEWIAGTDPTNKTSYFQISDYADGALTVPGTASRMYVLNFSTNLNESFVPIQTNFTGNEFSGNLSLTDTVHSAESPVFYKLEVGVP